ncbi:MAG TPA: serine/threonine-protein kinase [Nocardioidaceae bacterium]|nr:serine/threonine-protein kinase [Nocardioidaceae bacterium]
MTASWSFAHGDEIVPGLSAIKLLGGGNAYEAYLGWDEHLFAPVVVKIVRPDQVDDPATLRGLERETDMVGRLNHPVIVRGFRAVLDGPRPYLVLENLDGPRLSTLVRRYGKLPLHQLLPLGLEMCSALHYLRASGVVHLDVKPSNIIMGSPPRLIDLSIARSVEAAARLTHVIGTDAYLPPEQADPQRTGVPGPPADVWGLGATLFEAAAGYRPFEDGSPDEEAPLTERFPQLVTAPFELPEDFPEQVVKPVYACLEYDPANRPTPAELAGVLEPLVDALPKPKLGGFKPKL